MAKKYIDADLLKKEVEKRMHICDGVFERDSDTYYQGKAVAYQETLSLINSLRQEQSCDTCTNDKGCVTCKDGELWEGKEQPCEDLKVEEEIEKYMDIRGLIWYDDINLSDFARHFYELGKQSKEPVNEDLENAAREYATDTFPLSTEEYIDATAQDAFIAGAEWQKEQMLKDAVEGYVNYYEDGGGKLMAEAQVGCPYHLGDKVKIVIIPEKEEEK